VIDDDIVENANLQRQVIHKDSAIGTRPKSFCHSRDGGPEPLCHRAPLPFRRRTDGHRGQSFSPTTIWFADGTDNFDTRYLVNRTWRRCRLPLISRRTVAMGKGQLSIFGPFKRGAPCYNALPRQAPSAHLAPAARRPV